MDNTEGDTIPPAPVDTGDDAWWLDETWKDSDYQVAETLEDPPNPNKGVAGDDPVKNETWDENNDFWDWSWDSETNCEEVWYLDGEPSWDEWDWGPNSWIDGQPDDTLQVGELWGDEWWSDEMLESDTWWDQHEVSEQWWDGDGQYWWDGDGQCWWDGNQWVLWDEGEGCDDVYASKPLMDATYGWPQTSVSEPTPRDTFVEELEPMMEAEESKTIKDPQKHTVYMHGS